MAQLQSFDEPRKRCGQRGQLSIERGYIFEHVFDTRFLFHFGQMHGRPSPKTYEGKFLVACRYATPTGQKTSTVFRTSTAFFVNTGGLCDKR